MLGLLINPLEGGGGFYLMYSYFAARSASELRVILFVYDLSSKWISSKWFTRLQCNFVTWILFPVATCSFTWQSGRYHHYKFWNVSSHVAFE